MGSLWKNMTVKSYFSIMTKHNQMQLEMLLTKNLPDYEFTKKDLDRWVEIPNRNHNQFITVCDVNVGCYVTKQMPEKQELQLQAICLWKHFRGLGLGKMLLNQAIQEASRDKRFKTLTVQLTKEQDNLRKFFIDSN